MVCRASRRAHQHFHRGFRPRAEKGTSYPFSDLLTSVASMLDWSGDLGHEELADMQLEICRWRRIWPDEKTRSLLILRARQLADQVLVLSVGELASVLVGRASGWVPLRLLARTTLE